MMKNTYKGYSQESRLLTVIRMSLRAFSAHSYVSKYPILEQVSSFATALNSLAILICTLYQLSQGDFYVR